MTERKTTKKYYFSVEGETEQWYLQWLQKIINETEASVYNVSFDCRIQKNPLKRAKSMVVTGKTEVWHLSDYESDEPIHIKQFKETIDNMKKVKSLGKQITYQFGYSNFTFDLWMVLHKTDSNAHLSHRRFYLEPLNRAYVEHFENMDEYKRERNFKRCLGKLRLADVLDAIARAKAIMTRNQTDGYTLQEYKGYKYYRENPSLAIWEPIEKILNDCSLL
ncbi:RloB domain-containing protein [Phascolarctobacterium sp.]